MSATKQPVAVAAISPKQQRLERLWAEFLTKSPTPKQFRDVVRRSPELRNRAWEAYMATKPSKEDLLALLMDYEWRGFEEFPARVLINLYPEQSILKGLIERFPTLAKDAARRMLALPEVSREAIDFVLGHGRLIDDELNLKAAGMIIDKSPTEQELTYIFCRVKPLYEKAAGIVLASAKSESLHLLLIMEHCPDRQDKAWELLKKSAEGEKRCGCLRRVIRSKNNVRFHVEAANLLLDDPTLGKSDGDLFNAIYDIIVNVPDFRERVWERIKSADFYRNWWLAIAREAPELRERALAKAKEKQPPRDATAILDEISSVSSVSE